MAIAASGAAIKLKSLYVQAIPKSGREPNDSYVTRLTWQPTSRDKF